MKQERYRTGSPGRAYWYAAGTWVQEKTDSEGVTHLRVVSPGSREHAMLERKRARIIELKHHEEESE